MAELLPLFVAIYLLETAGQHAGQGPAGPGPAALGAGGWAVIIAVSLALWAGLCVAVRVILMRWRKAILTREPLALDSGRRRWDAVMLAWSRLSVILLMGWFAWLTCWLGWGAAGSRIMLPALLPWLAAEAVRVWSLDPPGHWRAHFAHLRQGLVLPCLAVIAVADLCTWTSRSLGIERAFIDALGLPMTEGLATALFIAAFILLQPPVLAWWFAAAPLAEGTASILRAAGERLAVPVRRLRLIERPGMVNAFVIGVLPWNRVVMFSRDLVDGLPERQLAAVYGHEIGHLRHRHFALRLVFLLAVAASSLLLAGTQREFAGWLALHLPASVPLPQVAMVAAMSVLLFLLKVGIFFGWISRACEHQADLAGAAVTDPATMSAALATVARLAHEDENAAGWTHPSTRARRDFLARVAADPGAAIRLHRRMTVLALALVAIALVLYAALAIIGRTHSVLNAPSLEAPTPPHATRSPHEH